jgi:hypothetical protein
LFRALLHFLAFVMVAVPAVAQVYKWVDERGVTHYGERPPQGGKASEVPNRLASPAPGDVPGSQGSSQPRSQVEGRPPREIGNPASLNRPTTDKPDARNSAISNAICSPA